MGRASALLDARRLGAAVLVAAIAAYFALGMRLPDIPGLWWDVVFMVFVLAPAVFALVLLALPYRRSRGLAPFGLAMIAVAFATQYAGADVLADFAKLGAMTAIGFWFLTYFEKLSWVVLVALVIPVVDTISVAGGPTNYIVREQPRVFDVLSFGFPLPGQRTVVIRWDEPRAGSAEAYNVYRARPAERIRPLNEEPLPPDARGFVDGAEDAHLRTRYEVEAVGADGEAERSSVVVEPVGRRGGSAASTTDERAPQRVRVETEPSSFDLGLPDFLFFAVFLAAAARWRLRVLWTWAAMILSLGVTMWLALWLDPFGLGGLPALPGIALAFLLPNADLLRGAFGRSAPE